MRCFGRLCKGYADHHFDSVANALHAAGMTAGLISLYVGIRAKHLRPLERLVSALWHPPQWYLYAWVGHFGLQKDVPAVFTYGLTPKSFLQGEFCSTMWVYGGGVFEPKASAVWPAGSAPPKLGLIGFAAVCLLLIHACTPAGWLWRKEWSKSAAAAKQKAR